MTRKNFCQICGAAMAVCDILVPIRYNPDTGVALPTNKKVWGCPEGFHELSFGYEGGHLSPHQEDL